MLSPIVISDSNPSDEYGQVPRANGCYSQNVMAANTASHDLVYRLPMRHVSAFVVEVWIRK